MKTKLFKSKFSLLAVVVMLSITLGACSLLTVPYITSAGNNRVVNIGDSIFALSGAESTYLHSYAGTTFRRYATSGAYLTGDSIVTSFSILDQFDKAKSDNANIKTVFMDGGGNDILIPAVALDPYNCKKDWWESGLSTTCKNLINDIYVEAVNTVNHMGQQGVQVVIWQGYYKLKNGLIGSTTLNDAVAYGNTKLSQAVANATAVPTRIFVNPTSVMNQSSDIIIDGVHPSTAGSQKLATLLWAQLKNYL
jgi:hypothetical protein